MDQAHVLSHELAHIAASPAAGHGPRFRAAHLDVARVLLGRHGAGRLAQAYERAGLLVDRRQWPPPTEHGIGGLLAVWESREALDGLLRR